MDRPTVTQLQAIPALSNGRWAYIRDYAGQFVVQAYIGGKGCKREFYGHQFKVDFENKQLVPII